MLKIRNTISSLALLTVSDNRKTQIHSAESTCYISKINLCTQENMILLKIRNAENYLI